MTDSPLVNNGIAAAMRHAPPQPKPLITEEQLLASKAPRHPVGPAGSTQIDICQWCFHPFTYTVKRSGKPRDSIEYEPLRKSLKISDGAFDPVICDACFEYVTQAALPDEKIMQPGWANSQAPNMLLAHGK